MTRLNILLLIAAVLCALLLVTSQHKARTLFNELELEQEKTKQLDVEWGQLQLEQSTWATPSRVEKLARERLHMLAPDARHTVVTPLPAERGVAAGDASRAPGTDAGGERQ
jgi:cell division protein FtsL